MIRTQCARWRRPCRDATARRVVRGWPGHLAPVVPRLEGHMCPDPRAQSEAALDQLTALERETLPLFTLKVLEMKGLFC